MDVYRKSIAWLIPVLDASREELALIRDPLRQFNEAEHLVHSTKKNMARYPEFDSLFPKMPSYLRRSAINFALGAVMSYRTRLAKWEADVSLDHTKGKPKLQT